MKEFINDQYCGILILPEGLNLDMDNYEIWKKTHYLKVKLLTNIIYYLLSYEKSYKKNELQIDDEEYE